MLNICTICKEEFEDDDSHELTDNDVCPACFKGVYGDFMEDDEPLIFDTEFYDKNKVDFTFEDLKSDLEGE